MSVFVHVAMVFQAGPVNELRSMITGRFAINVEAIMPGVRLPGVGFWLWVRLGSVARCTPAAIALQILGRPGGLSSAGGLSRPAAASSMACAALNSTADPRRCSGE
jgi:hypothetical protein